jgi:small conductance mechanosensitive channel
MEQINEMLNGETLSKAYELMAAFGLKLIAAIAVFVIGRWVARAVTRAVQRALAKAETDPTLVGFIKNVTYGGLMALVVIAAAGQLGVQTTSFIAVLGAAGLAVGLALQGSLANFAAGVLMIIFRPFKAGDFVEAGGVAGVVEEIELFTTKLRTPDNKTVIIPNGQVTAGSITNYSARDTRRVDMVFGIGYGDDIDKAKRIIREVLDADARVLKDPEPTVGLVELGDSSVNFAVRPWVSSADYWNVYFDIHEAMKKRFDAEGISIPFPQRDVHIHQASA